MKTLQEIKKEIEINQETRRTNSAEREKADNAFIAAHKAGDHDAARLASFEIDNLQKNAERISARGKVLTNNYNYILVETGKSALAEILKKYDGKQHGEKTAEKIRDEMRERGYVCYFPATHYFSQEKDCININERGAYGRGVEIWTKNRAKIVDENNIIHAEAVAEVVNPYKFINNIEKYLDKIERLTAETRKAFDAASAKAHELNEIAVDGLEWRN
jgi:hypothetical protein